MLLLLLFLLLLVLVIFFLVSIIKMNLKAKKIAKRESIEVMKGEEFEELVANTISSIFPEGKILRNIIIPNGRNGGTTEIDILLLTVKGFFCIECKNYNGFISKKKGKDNNGKMWQISYGKNYKKEFYSPVEQNARHVQCLKAKNMFPKQYFQSLVLFSDSTKLSDQIASIANVMYLKEAVSFLNEAKKAPHSEEDETEAIVNSIYSYLKTYEKADRTAHIEYVNKVKESMQGAV